MHRLASQVWGLRPETGRPSRQAGGPRWIRGYHMYTQLSHRLARIPANGKLVVTDLPTRGQAWGFSTSCASAG